MQSRMRWNMQRPNYCGKTNPRCVPLGFSLVSLLCSHCSQVSFDAILCVSTDEHRPPPSVPPPPCPGVQFLSLLFSCVRLNAAADPTQQISISPRDRCGGETRASPLGHDNDDDDGGAGANVVSTTYMLMMVFVFSCSSVCVFPVRALSLSLSL